GEDLDAGGAELPLGVPGPGLTGRVPRRLEPALEREEIDPAVAVDVAGADAVAGGGGAEVVLLPPGARAAVLQLVPGDDVDGVGQHLGGAVAVQVHQPGGLARAGPVDLVIGPLPARHAGVLDPADVPAEVGA